MALLPAFLAGSAPGLRALTPPLEETGNDLWVLTHRDSRHLRRVAAVFTHLAQSIVLPVNDTMQLR